MPIRWEPEETLGPRSLLQPLASLGVSLEAKHNLLPTSGRLPAYNQEAAPLIRITHRSLCSMHTLTDERNQAEEVKLMER